MYRGVIMPTLPEKAAINLKAVREKRPLVHSITNFVSANFVANVLLSVGASPVMASAVNEVEEMVSHANALVLNIGTLTEQTVTAMILAGQRAAAQNTPIILDPVGAGATNFRTASAQKLIAETDIDLIRGNATEILSLHNGDLTSKGVDAVHAVNDAVDTAKKLASELSASVAITGQRDVITDSRRTYHVANGHPLMARVTGMGCAATAMIGAFMTVDPDPVSAAATALAYYGLSGEIAGESSTAPGSFKTQMLDALYMITPDQLAQRCIIEIG